MMHRLIIALTLLTISSVSGFTLNSRCQRIISPSALFAEDEVVQTESQAAPSTAAEAVTKAAVRCPDCDLCDGSGRYVYFVRHFCIIQSTSSHIFIYFIYFNVMIFSILGGIGTVLEWWPIKAYRPCPNFVDRGGKYVRSGQGEL